MATSMYFGNLKGKLGNLVFYRMNGKDVVRTTPRPYERSEAMKKWAQSFGRAAQWSSFIKRNLSFLYVYHDLLAMQRRLTALFCPWLNQQEGDEPWTSESFNFLKGFQLSLKTICDMSWKDNLGVLQDPEEGLVLSVSELRPLLQRYTGITAFKVVYTVAAISFTPSDLDLKGSFVTSFEMAVDAAPLPPQQINMNIHPAPGQLTVVLASLSVYDAAGALVKKGKKVMEMGEVIAAVYE